MIILALVNSRKNYRHLQGMLSAMHIDKHYKCFAHRNTNNNLDEVHVDGMSPEVPLVDQGPPIISPLFRPDFILSFGKVCIR